MIGTILKSRYKIVEELGKGGFGETFIAEDLRKFNRRCVVKKFSIQNPNQDQDQEQSFKDRFELEAKTLMELGEHDQIPELYAYYEDGYLVQEFIVGRTLDKILSEEGPFPEKRVKEILISLLSVLEYVHSKEKIHRDIKPNNIILRERDGLPVLIDFGAVKEKLAKLSAESQENLISATIPIGTEGYTAPEQMNGVPNDCSDLYSLGATAQCLLTGKNPKLLTASRKGDKGWLKHVPNISESSASIINKSVQLETYNRYATAVEMRDDLLNSRIVHFGDDDNSTKSFRRGEPLINMATGQQLIAVKPPSDFNLPPEHLYLGEGKQTGEHLLYRKRDGQVVLYIPKDIRMDKPFLIDKHLVTNAQFAIFLNDPDVQQEIRQTRLNDVTVAVNSDGSLLLADAPGFWERNRNEPLGRTAGLTYTSQRWIPVAGSEHLPITLVTVRGATWYAAWLRKLPPEEAEIGDGLPRESQWMSAALFDENAGSLRRFPWGDAWDRQKLNNLSYWAGRDLTKWGTQYAVKTGLTPVGFFPDGASPCGMMDAFGNVWEWLKDSDQSGKHMMKGGAYTSPISVFEAASMFRQPDFLGQAIGFRCCWYI